MEKTLTLKDGRKVLVRDIRANDDVFELARFINELVEDKEYILINKPMTPETEADWLRGKIKDIEKNKCIDWRVFLGGKCVGGVEAKKGIWKREHNVEFGIALSKEVRGQGLGRQLLTMMIEEAKKQWSPRNFFIQALGDNQRALRLYRSVGFKDVAVIPEYSNHFGKYTDEIWLRLEE